MELWLNIMGMHTASVSAAYFSHTLFTNLRWEPDDTASSRSAGIRA